MVLIADESVDYRIITFLRQRSFKVIAIIDDNASIADSEVLNISNNENALLITEDKDFGDLVFRMNFKHSGILLLRFFSTPVENKNQKVFETIHSYYDNLKNNFSTLSDKRLRIRKTTT